MRKNTRKRLMWGGGAILAVGVLVGLIADFPRMGVGNEGGNVLVSASTETPRVETPVAVPETGVTSPVVTVLIEGHSYLILRSIEGVDSWEHAERESVVRLAKQAGGDEDGVRVRVLRRQSARASAENELRQALADAGLSGDAVYWQKEFVQ